MASTEAAKPRRGDVWLVRFGTGEPGEPTKNRPAVVISSQAPGQGSIYDLCVVVPVSASLRPALSRPLITAAPAGLEQVSVAVPNALRGVSPKRLLKRLGHVDGATMRQIDGILAALLGLPL